VVFGTVQLGQGCVTVRADVRDDLFVSVEYLGVEHIRAVLGTSTEWAWREGRRRRCDGAVCKALVAASLRPQYESQLRAPQGVVVDERDMRRQLPGGSSRRRSAMAGLPGNRVASCLPGRP
jgi:hypothetical protein